VNYLMTKQAKVVAMTCTHAALKRRDFLQLAFQYDSLVMEESAQILEIETFIPMLLQARAPKNHLEMPLLLGERPGPAVVDGMGSSCCVTAACHPQSEVWSPTSCP